MSGSKTRKPADPNKPKRPVGPRTLYIIFDEGASQEIVDAVKAARITFNGRDFLNNLQGAAPKPFVVRKVDVTPKGGEPGASE